MKMSFTTFACPNWSLRQIIRAAAKHQYNGIEFRIDAGHAHGVEAWSSPVERRRFREQIETQGLTVACIASSLQFVVEGMVEQAVARVQLAADMGAPGIRVFFGQLPEGMTSIDEAVERVARQLREAAETAQALEVEIWLETHDMLCKGADAAAIIHAVDRPNVAICYNNLHPIRRGESLETTIAHLAPMIRHVHLHDGLNWPDKVIITPFGKGDMPLDDTVTALRNIGYAGFLSGEWFHNQYGDNIEDALELYSFEVRTLTHKLGVGLGLG
jgi:sugar phosphate isomerase/epimerase